MLLYSSSPFLCTLAPTSDVTIELRMAQDDSKSLLLTVAITMSSSAI